MQSKTYKLPTNSKIHIDSKKNELLITLPYRVASGWDKFTLAIAFFSSIFMTVLCFSAVQKLLFTKSITNDELFWLILFIVGGGVALWQINLIFRKKTPETLILTPTELFFNSGRSPLYGAEKQDELMHYSYLKKRTKVFICQDLEFLVLSKTKDESLYLLSFEDDLKQDVFFAYRMTNEERIWLYETILKFYGLEDYYTVIEMDESKPKKRIMSLFIWIIFFYGFFFLVASVMRSMNLK